MPESIPISEFDTDSLILQSYGGINTESSPVSMPISDTPAMLNIDVSPSGKLRKRGGSVVRSINRVGYPSGLLAFIDLPTGEELVFTKNGTGLSGGVLPSKTSNDEIDFLWEITYAFHEEAAYTTPSFVVTNERYPRLIVTHGNSVPIEMEVALVEAVGDGTDTIKLEGATLVNDFLVADTYAVYGSTTVLLSTLTYSGTTSDFKFTSTIPDGQRVSIVSPVFHWWSEAIKITNEISIGYTYRYNDVEATDTVIEIPDGIQRGLLADYTSLGLTSKMLPVIVGSYTHTVAPTTEGQFAFSSGNAAPSPSFGSSHVSFGTVEASGNTTKLKFYRQHYLPFNGQTGCVLDDLLVYDNVGNYTESTTGGAGRYYKPWKLATGALTGTTTGTDNIVAVSLNVGTPYGVQSKTVSVVNTAPPTKSGNDCMANKFDRTLNGSHRPVYGLSEYCNYSLGTFPSVVSLVQGRLVLSGCSSSPLTVLFSNSNDWGTDTYYQNFDVIYEDQSLSTNPIIITLNGKVNETITSIDEWFGSIFIFTNENVYRLFSSDNGVLNASNANVMSVATVGCSASNCTVRTDSNIMFVSRGGVYKLELVPQTYNYYATKVSTKIESILRSDVVNTESEWICYNSTDKRVYVSFSDGDKSMNQRLFIYHIDSDSWSEYALYSGYLPSSFGACKRDRLFINVVDRDTDDISEADSDSSYTSIVEFNREDLVIDMVRVKSYSDFPIVVQGQKACSFTHSVNSSGHFVNLSKKVTGSKGFRLMPVDGYEQVYVEKDSNALTFQEDYFNKSISNSLYFVTHRWYTGDSVLIELTDEHGNYPISVLADNNYLESGTDFTLTIPTDYYRVALTDSYDSDVVFIVGFEYPCYHITPTFTRRVPHREKRAIHYVGYYSNYNFLDLYKVDDVNTDSGQPASDIVDHPKIVSETNVAITYNNQRDGSITYEIFNSEGIVWDYSLFDSPLALFQQSDIVRIVLPIIGMGYSFSVCNFNFRQASFELVGYMVETKAKGRNSRR